MNPLASQKITHYSASTLNDKFNSITKRFKTCKTFMLNELAKQDLEKRSIIFSTLEYEAQQIKIKLTQLLQQSPANFTEYIAVIMWNLSSHLSYFKDILYARKITTADEATILIAEKQLIIDFLIFLKVVDVLQPYELRELNITAVLEKEEYRQLVELIQ